MSVTTKRHKLFRAIVVMGAAMTSSACEDQTRCHHCSPADAPGDGVVAHDATTSQTDAGVADTPTDDFVAIL